MLDILVINKNVFEIVFDLIVINKEIIRYSIYYTFRNH